MLSEENIYSKYYSLKQDIKYCNSAILDHWDKDESVDYLLELVISRT